MKSDDEWNIENNIERGYLKAGLKRFQIDHNMLDKKEHVEAHVDDWQSTTTRSDSKSLMDYMSCGSSSGVVVKLENPDLLAMHEEIKVLRSGDPKVLSTIGQFKKLKATLGVMNTTSSTWLRY